MIFCYHTNEQPTSRWLHSVYLGGEAQAWRSEITRGQPLARARGCRECHPSLWGHLQHPKHTLTEGTCWVGRQLGGQLTVVSLQQQNTEHYVIKSGYTTTPMVCRRFGHRCCPLLIVRSFRLIILHLTIAHRLGPLRCSFPALSYGTRGCGEHHLYGYIVSLDDSD